MTADRDFWSAQMGDQYPVVERPGWDGLAINDLDDCMCTDDEEDKDTRRLAVLTVLSGLLLLGGLTAAIVHRLTT